MLGWRLVSIKGASMAPALRAGDYALFRRRRRYNVGDTVLVDHPEFGLIVKQIAEIGATGLELKGTGPLSTSQARLGQLPFRRLKGRLVWVFKAPTSTPQAAKSGKQSW